MKKKVYRLISELSISDNGTVEFQQRMSSFYFLAFGMMSFLFKKKDKTICNKNEIEKIESSSTTMGGNLITITTKDTKHVLEMKSKATLGLVVGFLEQSELSSKLVK